MKHDLGWSQYQVRSDEAIRRHWQLVCCAFSFCWYYACHPSTSTAQEAPELAELQPSVPADETGTGKKSARKSGSATNVLTDGAESSARLVGALDHAQALLAWLVATAPISSVAVPPRVA